MLISSNNSELCSRSISGDGCCCCNCQYRALLEVDGFPMGYYCICPVFTHTVTFLGFSGHSMCECHRHVDLVDGFPAVDN